MTSTYNQSSRILECLCHFWFSCLVVQVLWHVLDPTGLRRGPLATTGRLDPCLGGRGMTTASGKADTWWRSRSAMVPILGDIKTTKCIDIKSELESQQVNSEAEQQLLTGMYGAENYHWIGFH